MNSRIYEFECIYPRRLWICIGTDPVDGFTVSDMYGEVVKHAGLADESAAETTNVYDVKNKVGGLLIQFRDVQTINFGRVAHEAYHVACEIMDFIGFKHDYKNQEPMAYLIEWVAGCCQEVLMNSTKPKNE